MKPIPIIILPGLDGSDLLLQRFIDLAPSDISARVVSLPDDSNADYNALVGHVSAIIGTEPCHIIAESFSGPIGILLAHRIPEFVSRLTLVASFASPPTPSFARYIPWSLLFRLPMPRFVAQRYFLGPATSLIPTLRAAIRTACVPTLVQRLHCVMNANVTDELSEIKCPIDYVRPSKDRLISDRVFRNLLMVNPNTYVIPIDGPHLIMQTKPKETWAGILGRTFDKPE